MALTSGLHCSQLPTAQPVSLLLSQRWQHLQLQHTTQLLINAELLPFHVSTCKISHLWIPLKDDDPAALVAGGEEVPVLVELDAGDDVGLGDVIVEGALHLREAPLHLARR